MKDTGVFEQMLELGKDNALLRFTLGSAFFKQGRFDESAEHLRKAVEFNADYTAAWKMLGKTLLRGEQFDEAVDALQKGIEAANKKGDKQAEKEMQVFLKRAKNSLKEQ
jgi:tetratricopeptide (TPR) repeat protein